jgi:hypothetical protein
VVPVTGIHGEHCLEQATTVVGSERLLDDIPFALTHGGEVAGPVLPLEELESEHLRQRRGLRGAPQCSTSLSIGVKDLTKSHRVVQQPHLGAVVHDQYPASPEIPGRFEEGLPRVAFLERVQKLFRSPPSSGTAASRTWGSVVLGGDGKVIEIFSTADPEYPARQQDLPGSKSPEGGRGSML